MLSEFRQNRTEYFIVISLMLIVNLLFLFSKDSLYLFNDIMTFGCLFYIGLSNRRSLVLGLISSFIGFICISISNICSGLTVTAGYIMRNGLQFITSGVTNENTVLSMLEIYLLCYISYLIGLFIRKFSDTVKPKILIIIGFSLVLITCLSSLIQVIVGFDVIGVVYGLVLKLGKDSIVGSVIIDGIFGALLTIYWLVSCKLSEVRVVEDKCVVEEEEQQAVEEPVSVEELVSDVDITDV